jgi:hypothetical protein
VCFTKAKKGNRRYTRLFPDASARNRTHLQAMSDPAELVRHVVGQQTEADGDRGDNNAPDKAIFQSGHGTAIYL